MRRGRPRPCRGAHRERLADCTDRQALHQLEQELNVEILPGTEIMTDVGSRHFLKSAGNSDRVLVPQPSADPHDPLVSPA